MFTSVGEAQLACIIPIKAKSIYALRAGYCLRFAFPFYRDVTVLL